MNIAKRRIVAAVIILTMAVMAQASSWEGSAMMGTYGDFPATGYYAACNSFARNTTVEVVNLENGRSITVIVTRGLESSGIFMMLSIEAANALGVQQGRVSRIRASEPRSAIELAPASSSSIAIDPDFNPRVFAAEELKRLGYELTPSVAAVPTAVPAPVAPIEAPVAAPPVAAPAATVAPAVTVAPAATVAPTATVAPAAVDRTVPAPIAPPRVSSVAVAEPASVASERPESVASAKPKPVRTIVLPQLPEPSTPAMKAPEAPAAVAPAATPEAVAMSLPVPDETPIRVAASAVPKRYDAPAQRPEVSTRGLVAPLGVMTAVALSEPVSVAESRAAAYARSVPRRIESGASAELYDPSSPASERADSLARMAPGYSGTNPEYSLYDPESPTSEGAEALARMAPGFAYPEFEYTLYDPAIKSVELADALARQAPGYSAPGSDYALFDPDMPIEERADALARQAPGLFVSSLDYAFFDPDVPEAERAAAFALLSPLLQRQGLGIELAWPELEADEVPDIALGLLAAPPAEPVPATSLAEGEIVFPERVGPYALTLQTPEYGAAETTVALAEAEEKAGEIPAAETASEISPMSQEMAYELAEAEEKAKETPTVETRAGVSPYVETSSAGLAEAVEHKPETAPYVEEPAAVAVAPVPLEQPKEYIVALEPTGPKPPVAAVAPPVTAPVAPKPVTVVPKPAPVAAAPIAAKPVILGALEKGRYYIQIGAFSSESTAKEVSAPLGKNFVVLLQKMTDKGKDTYRVFVGPLSRDESGVALVKVRAMGYKDAFLKSGS